MSREIEETQFKFAAVTVPGKVIWLDAVSLSEQRVREIVAEMLDEWYLRLQVG